MTIGSELLELRRLPAPVDRPRGPAQTSDAGARFLIVFVEADLDVAARSRGAPCRAGWGAVVVSTTGPTRQLEATVSGRHGWLAMFSAALVGMSPAVVSWAAAINHPAWLSFIRPADLSGLRELAPACTRRWSCAFEAMGDELRARPPGYNQAIRNQLSLLLLELARMSISRDRLRPAPSALVADMMGVIDRRYREPLSLEAVAAELAISPAHLARTVRASTGHTVNAWIMERRMAEARHMLVSTDDKVEAVALRVGFRDVGYFRRQFRRCHGVPPREWRDAGRAPAAFAI